MKTSSQKIHKKSINPDPLLTEIEAAEYLDASPKTLPIWRHKSVGPDYVKVGRNVRYKQSALDEYLEKQTVRVGN